MLSVGAYFDFTHDDLSKGLRHFKGILKHQYRALSMRYHPDRQKARIHGRGVPLNGRGFKEMSKEYDRLLGLKEIPLTYTNFETIFWIKKGYKTTEDFPEIFA